MWLFLCKKVKEPALLLLLKCCNLCKKHSIMAWGSIILCRDISLALLRCPVCRSAYHPGQRASPSVLKTLNRLNPSNPSRLHQPKSFVQRNAPSQPKRATKMTSTTSHRSLRDTARKLPAHDRLICPPILATHQFWFFGFWSFYFSYAQSRVDDTQRSILFSASFRNPSQSLAPIQTLEQQGIERQFKESKLSTSRGFHPSSGAIVQFLAGLLSHPVRPGCSRQTSTALVHVVARATWTSLRLATKKVQSRNLGSSNLPLLISSLCLSHVSLPLSLIIRLCFRPSKFSRTAQLWMSAFVPHAAAELSYARNEGKQIDKILSRDHPTNQSPMITTSTTLQQLPEGPCSGNVAVRDRCLSEA